MLNPEDILTEEQLKENATEEMCSELNNGKGDDE